MIKIESSNITLPPQHTTLSSVHQVFVDTDLLRILILFPWPMLFNPHGVTDVSLQWDLMSGRAPTVLTINKVLKTSC